MGKPEYGTKSNNTYRYCHLLETVPDTKALIVPIKNVPIPAQAVWEQ